MRIPILGATRREFIARIIADLGKTIFAIGLASYFFEKLGLALRLALGLMCGILIIGSIFIEPRIKGGD